MSESEPIRDPDCRVCVDCRGAHHHWMEDFDDGKWEYSPEPRPVWVCKHCKFTMPYDSDDPDGDFATMMLAKHAEPHPVEPGGCAYTLPLFSDEDEQYDTSAFDDDMDA